VPVKGNSVDSGSNLMAETLSWLLLSYKTSYRLPGAKYYYIVSTFLVEHGVPPSGEPSNYFKFNVSQILF